MTGEGEVGAHSVRSGALSRRAAGRGSEHAAWRAPPAQPGPAPREPPQPSPAWPSPGCPEQHSPAQRSAAQRSAAAAHRSTSPPKSAWPGVSMMLILVPLYRTAVFCGRGRERERGSTTGGRGGGGWTQAARGAGEWTGAGGCARGGAPGRQAPLPSRLPRNAASTRPVAPLAQHSPPHLPHEHRTLDRMVMPRSRSRSVLSMMRTCSIRYECGCGCE